MHASEIYSKRLNAKELIFPNKMENSWFWSQMDEKDLLPEIRTWERPPWYGTTQLEEKVKEIFLENQKGLHLHHLKTHIRMPVKQEMVHVGKLHLPPARWTQSRTLLAERRIIPYSTKRHWRLQNYLLIRTWMLCKKAASMTTGISMVQEICLILGQVSHNLLYWKKNLVMDICGLGGD